MIEIVDPGPLATVQDLGRRGYVHLGVGRSGAADRPSHTLANRLVGNAEGAATVETTFGGLRLRADVDVLVAVTGATSPVLLGGTPQALNAPLRLPAGVELVLGAPERGLRGYLGVRGGVAVAPVLGSRSTDLLSGIGPAPLRTGDRLPVGRDTVADPLVDQAPVLPPALVPVLRVLPGPHGEWFDDAAWPALLATTWTASPDSNRIAVRLRGPALVAEVNGDPPSAPLVPGAVQVPFSARPLVFLADHPVTGGYPVLAVVVEADLPAAAQLRPGQPIRFRPA
ncbi:MAG: biotin-dependent carboxyltransferase family protein [Geodermatophilaceae bacterium]|nr:biotin-dependent carboxyltransferase family protein [Geodermatophilaceae bacterium]